jgi:RecJ-like exonuclease
LLSIANQGTAKSNIGDYVEVTGVVDQQANSVHVESLKMLTQGRAKCDLPKRSEK